MNWLTLGCFDGGCNDLCVVVADNGEFDRNDREELDAVAWNNGEVGNDMDVHHSMLLAMAYNFQYSSAHDQKHSA